jgi:hypothetical protein
MTLEACYISRNLQDPFVTQKKKSYSISRFHLIAMAGFCLPGLLTTSTRANPKANDDYVACLIGRAAVALHNQSGTKDAAKAQQVAYRQCKTKGRIDHEEGEGVSDFVNIMVERMANDQGR